MPDWEKETRKYRNPSDKYVLPVNNPKMLDYISQNYRIYTTEQGGENTQQKTMSTSYKIWLDKIKDTVKENSYHPLKLLV